MAVVSVILPTYNRAHCLQRAVASVIAQHFGDWELILVDDGSTDDTIRLRKQFAGLLGGRYRDMETDRLGPANARNAGMALARGDWIAFIDSDDIWAPEKLDAQLMRLASRSDCDLCFTSFFTFGDDLEILNAWHPISGQLMRDTYPQLLRIQNNQITCPSVVVRRSLIESLSGFDEAMRVCEDIDLWTRAALATKFCVVRAPLVGVHHRTGGEFPYVASLRGRADLYERARLRDPSLSQTFVLVLYEEAFATFRAIADQRGDSVVGRLLERAERAAPKEEAARIQALALSMRDIAEQLVPALHCEGD